MLAPVRPSTINHHPLTIFLKDSHYIGIDFGTSSSCFSIIPEKVLTPNPICFEGDATIDTAVLWDLISEPKTVKAFGTTAVKEWGYASPEEKKSRALCTQFKPDITVSTAAAENATAFLRCAGEYMKANSILPRGLPVTEFPVIAGVPAHALPGYEEAIKSIYSAAGFRQVKLVKEPVGALIHHVSRDDIPVYESRKGILIIDFGGGTCDIAYLLRLDIKHAWGDPLLGGRLFDDLFYQWLCEVNTDAVKKIEAEGDAYYIHWVKCREMKEAFSNTMRRNRDERFHFNIPGYGSLQNVTWPMFEERARSYVPSREFFEDLSTFGDRYAELVSGEPVDLLHRFESALRAGVDSGTVSLAHIERVILTGGSSLWPFVRETVIRVLSLDASRILESANPRGAIGEGLALMPVVQNRFRESIHQIQREQHAKSTEILQTINAVIMRFSQGLCRDITEKIVHERIVPALEQFRQSGGTLHDLRLRLEADINACQPELTLLIADRTPELAAKVKQTITSFLAEWFQSRHIRMPEQSFAFSTPEQSLDPRLLGKIMDEVAILVSPVIAIIIASICGGGGMALVLSGIPGLVIGAVIALTAVFAGRKAIEYVSVSSTIARGMLNGVVMKLLIRRAHHLIEKKMLHAISDKLDQEKITMANNLSELIQERIDDLSALDTL